MTDSLKIATVPNDAKISDIRFRLKLEDIREKEFVTNPGEVLLLTFNVKSDPLAGADILCLLHN